MTLKNYQVGYCCSYLRKTVCYWYMCHLSTQKFKMFCESSCFNVIRNFVHYQILFYDKIGRCSLDFDNTRKVSCLLCNLLKCCCCSRYILGSCAAEILPKKSYFFYCGNVMSSKPCCVEQLDMVNFSQFVHFSEFEQAINNEIYGTSVTAKKMESNSISIISDQILQDRSNFHESNKENKTTSTGSKNALHPTFRSRLILK